jgi:hypothetical protein
LLDFVERFVQVCDVHTAPLVMSWLYGYTISYLIGTRNHGQHLQECVVKILTSDVCGCVYMMPSFVFGEHRGSFLGLKQEGHDINLSSQVPRLGMNVIVPLFHLFSPWYGQDNFFFLTYVYVHTHTHTYIYIYTHTHTVEPLLSGLRLTVPLTGKWKGVVLNNIFWLTFPIRFRRDVRTTKGKNSYLYSFLK